jgi:uncharacterized membrane protein
LLIKTIKNKGEVDFMTVLLTIIIGVLFALFALASIRGIAQSYQKEYTVQQWFGLVLIIVISIFLGILLFTGSLVIY